MEEIMVDYPLGAWGLFSICHFLDRGHTKHNNTIHYIYLAEAVENNMS